MMPGKLAQFLVGHWSVWLLALCHPTVEAIKQSGAQRSPCAGSNDVPEVEQEEAPEGAFREFGRLGVLRFRAFRVRKSGNGCSNCSAVDLSTCSFARRFEEV